MNRHSITTNARALPGTRAFACGSGRMALGLIWAGRLAAGSRSPGEGDVASP